MISEGRLSLGSGVGGCLTVGTWETEGHRGWGDLGCAFTTGDFSFSLLWSFQGGGAGAGQKDESFQVFFFSLFLVRQTLDLIRTTPFQCVVQLERCRYS